MGVTPPGRPHHKPDYRTLQRQRSRHGYRGGDALQLGKLGTKTALKPEEQTLYLQRVVVQGGLTTAEGADIVRTIILSDFDKPVDIAPPFLGG